MVDIIVRNFQAVEEAKIRVDGFTILRGESNGGKSSTLKALYAATHNRFTSTQVRYGEDHALIKVRWDAQDPVLSVMRKATGASPLMKLGAMSFNKLSRSVPQEVEDFNNFGTLQVGSEKYSLNFFTQFQKPLLLDYSQKKVMDILSASRSMDELMMVTNRISELKSENKGAFISVDAIITQTKADLSKVKFDITGTQSIVDLLEDFLKKYETNTAVLDELSELKDLLDKLFECKESVRSAQDKLEKLSCIEQAQEEFEQAQSLTSMFRSFETEVYRYGVVVDNLALANKRFEVIKTLDVESNKLAEVHLRLHYLNHAKAAIEGLNSLKPKADYLAQAPDLFNQLIAVRVRLTGLRSFSMVVEEWNRTKDKVVDTELILTNNLCPLCGQPLTRS